MTDRHDSMLEKVRKMLALAEDPAATEQEAEAFTAKAAELMAKYGIDQALLGDLHLENRQKVGDRVVLLHPPYARDKAGLLNGIVNALGGRCVLRKDSSGVDSIHMFGFTSDLERVELLYTSLLIQMANGVIHADRERRWNEDLRAFRRSWYAGFSAAVSGRLKEAERKAHTDAEQHRTEGRSVALVVADRKSEVTQAVTDRYPRLRQGRSRQLSGSGFRSGRQAGERADIGSKRVAGSNAGALSR